MRPIPVATAGDRPTPLPPFEAAPALAADCYVQAFRLCSHPMVLVDPDTWTVAEANAAAEHLLRRPGHSLRGLPWRKLAADGATAEDLQRFARSGAQTAAPPKEWKLLRADGYILLAEAQVVLCDAPDGRRWLLVQLRDATADHVAASQMWAESQAASYRLLIECMGEGFLALDDERRIVFANHSAERLLGEPRDRLIGRPIDDLFPAWPPETPRAATPEEAEANTPPFIVPRRRADGATELFECHGHRRAGVTAVLFCNATERVQHEMEIARLNATMAASQELLRAKNAELNQSLDQLARLNAQLAQADRLKSEFLANTSHELRTPLNSLIGFLQLVREGLYENEAERDQFIANAIASANHLLQLINDVLDIAKIEAGKMTLLIDEVDVQALFEEVHSLTHVQARQKRLELNFVPPPPQCSYIRADFNKAKQILINLVGNAIKFTDQGWIRVQAQRDPVNADMMLFTVQDTGAGVPRHLQQAVFEKFMQVDGTSTRRHQGTGLGLTITKNLVELMGGTINLTSEGPGCGTTVCFTLPLANRCQSADGPDANEVWREGADASF